MSNEAENVRKELEKDIVEKLDAIKERVLTGHGHNVNSSEYLHVLAYASDELTDVLLNWETDAISSDLGAGMFLDD